MKPMSLNSIIIGLLMVLAGCSAVSDWTSSVPGQGVKSEQILIQTSGESQQQSTSVEITEQQSMSEKQPEPNLLESGFAFLNGVASNVSNPEAHFTDFLPDFTGGFLSNQSSLENRPQALGSNGTDIQQLDNSSQPMGQKVDKQVSRAPSNAVGLVYHSEGGAGRRALEATTPQKVNTLVQTSSKSEASIDTILVDWVSQISSGLSNQSNQSNQTPPSAASNPADNDGLLPYAQPQRTVTLQRFDGSSASAMALIKRMGGGIDPILEGRPVPAIAFQALPDDMSSTMPGNKELFLSIMVPIAALVNEQIMAERQAIAATGYQGPISTAPLLIQQIAQRYEVNGHVTDLLNHVDTLPVSLMLAQSIEESGWGTSRFAQEGNALFGQYTWDSNDPGIVPGNRPKGKNFRIRAFPSLLASMQSYALNLNRHKAYADLRALRSLARREGRWASGQELAQGLSQYSGDPGYYIPAIQGHLVNNNLSRYDRLRLLPGPMLDIIGASAPIGR